MHDGPIRQHDGLTRQQVQTMLIIERSGRRGVRGEYRNEFDTAPHPMDGEKVVWPVEYLYARDHILVREEHVEQARRIVYELARRRHHEGQQTQPAQLPVATPVLRGLRELALPERVSVPDALAAIRDGIQPHDEGARKLEGLGPGVAAPDHVISITHGVPMGAGGTCPATEPDPVPEGAPPDPAPTLDRYAGYGVRIVVLDTGLDLAAVNTHRWLAGVTGDPDPAIGNRAPLGAYAGHGTFIAGVIRSVAPRAEVHVRADFKVGGIILETNLVRALDEVLAKDDPDVISMSAGVWDTEATGPLSFQVFHETRLRHHKGVVLVTAAGNDGARRPFWPAAAPWTVSVGARSADWRQRAGFSNFGGWVDVYAPGEDLVNAFPTGRYDYVEPPRQGSWADFTGMARWSGTSFATPMVAGMIAARMSRTGENGVDAAAALLGIARTGARLGTGAVLLPS
jgi:hypothetical protein